MKYLLTLILFFFLFSSNCATKQNDSIHLKRVYDEGCIMVKALLQKDYKTFVSYAYRPLVDTFGGEEKMIANVKEGIDKLEAQGTFFINLTLEKPTSIIHTKNELQCVVRENIEMKIPDGGVLVGETLIAISIDDGENWEFLNTHNKTLEALKVTFPNLSESLIIPAYLAPTFYRD